MKQREETCHKKQNQPQSIGENSHKERTLKTKHRGSYTRKKNDTDFEIIRENKKK